MTKKSSPVVDILNDVLTAELTAINQYFLHAELCNHWGYKKLYAFVRKQSIDEMKHAEQLIERILFLNGIPNVQRMGKVNTGETVTEQFTLDKALEMDAVSRLNKGIEEMREFNDNGSRMLLEGILQSEEEHLDWLDTQLDIIKSIGEPAYLSQKIGDDE